MWKGLKNEQQQNRYRQHFISLHTRYIQLSLDKQAASKQFLCLSWFQFSFSEMWQMNGAQIVTTSFQDKKLEVFLTLVCVLNISFIIFFYRFCAFCNHHLIHNEQHHEMNERIDKNNQHCEREEREWVPHMNADECFNCFHNYTKKNERRIVLCKIWVGRLKLIFFNFSLSPQTTSN